MSTKTRKIEFTSEAVSEGHPDKVADRISDEILDDCLKQNPHARVAVETMVTKNECIVAGEIGGVPIDSIDVTTIARFVLSEVGYLFGNKAFEWDPGAPRVLLQPQSEEIANAVGPELEGAGDQGIMFGYACDEAPEYMPAALYYSQHLLRQLDRARKSTDRILGPDAKAQVTLSREEGSREWKAETIVVSHQHLPAADCFMPEVIHRAIKQVFPASMLQPSTRVLVNPSGSFTRGGPAADTGLTGRKIIADTYGGAAPHGGGAFSGKDPSKVDRTGAYAARWVAKNIVAAGLAEKALIQLAYVIGVAEPVSVTLKTEGATKIDDEALSQIIRNLVDFRPRALRDRLRLNRPIYGISSVYGAFGRKPSSSGSFPWENLDLVSDLQAKF